MRVIAWIVRLAIFVVLLGFALSNTETVTLSFFGVPEAQWRAPFVLFLLIFFAAGAVVGALAMLPALFRHKRQLSQQRRELERLKSEMQRPPEPASQAEIALIQGVRDPGLH